MEIDRGYISPQFVTNSEKLIVEFENARVLPIEYNLIFGLRFLGKVLSIERAITPPHYTKSQQNKSMSGNYAKPSIDDATTLAKDSKQESMTKSLPALEPIAEKLGVEYLFSPHLVYAYPLPYENILTNILNALIVVPRFYTHAILFFSRYNYLFQVLHLMNKMNIPAPFRAALPTPPLPPSPHAPHPPPPPPVDTNSTLAHLSSGESELESSDGKLGRASLMQFSMGSRFCVRSLMKYIKQCERSCQEDDYVIITVIDPVAIVPILHRVPYGFMLSL